MVAASVQKRGIALSKRHPMKPDLGSIKKLRDTLQWNPEPGRPVVEFISQLIYGLGDDEGIQ
jgi:hypothetical protein